jgi:Zn-dependent protease with chaperone function
LNLGNKMLPIFFPYFFLCIAGCGLYLADTMYLFWTLVNKPHTPIVSDPCFHLAVSLLFLFIVCITVLLVMAYTWLKPSIHFWPWWTNITPHLQILVFTLLLGFSFMCVVWLTLEIKHVVYQANDKPKIYE